MRNALLFFFTLMLVSMLPAQDQKQDRDQDRDQVRLQEHILLMDGKVYQIRDRDQIQLRERILLQNGTIVNPDGTYQFQDQKQRRLRDGECLDMDGNRYKSQQEFSQRQQSRDQAMNQEHLMWQDGRMYHFRNQEKSQLREKLSLNNGSSVNPDGTWEGKNGNRKQLRDGECLDMDGKRYRTQDQFRDKMEHRNMQRMERMNRDMGTERRGQMDPNMGRERIEKRDPERKGRNQ